MTKTPRTNKSERNPADSYTKQMDLRGPLRRLLSICFSILFTGIFSFFFTACTGNMSQITTRPAETLQVSPTQKRQASPMPSSTFTQVIPTATLACTDDLLFIDDLTIPDGTIVSPGSSLDKRWLVENSGDCNWDSRYRLHLIAGTSLGVTSDQSLYPARAGTQADIRIIFSAPQTPGVYISEWQAYNPDGVPFGQSFFIKIVVQ